MSEQCCNVISILTISAMTSADVVASPDDPGVPREISELMRDEIPGAEFHWLSPEKHLATLEHPERFNRIMLDFLAKHVR